jgi:hypothetical protein
MKAVPFEKSFRAPGHVLVRELMGESVLLNLESGTYFGLDEVGTRMWTVLTTASSMQEAFEALRGDFDVEPETLRRDLEALVAQLLEKGLLEAVDG